MNNDALASSPEEGNDSLSFDKMPKLNLPPKPVRASMAPVIENTTLTTIPPIQKQAVPPSPSSNGNRAKLESDAKSLLLSEDERSLKQSPFSLSVPTAIISILVALLALIVQIAAFFNLF